MEDEFWAPRASFQTPIPEVEGAADLLALAADSLIARDKEGARLYLAQANMPTLRTYMRGIASQVTREIHRFRDVPGLAAPVHRSERGPRQPSSATALEIYHRDGFRCRYCGCRIVFPQAQNVISALVPGAVRWGAADAELNAAFYTLKGVLDHIDPHAHGGGSKPDNLVVACQPCNYGKGAGFIQQFGLSDPRLRPPRVDAWDGLIRVLPLRPAGPRTVSAPPPGAGDKPERAIRQKMSPKQIVTIDEFAASFSAADRRHLDVLVQVLESCRDLGVYWTARRVLLANIRTTDIMPGSAISDPTPSWPATAGHPRLPPRSKASSGSSAVAEDDGGIGDESRQPGRGTTLNALGVEADATVQIPWSIGPYKQAFRSFAETLAAGLPDATVYETEKMWRVRCLGRPPRLSELMQNPEAVRDAFIALHRALTGRAN